MNAVVKQMLVSNALIKKTPLPVVYEEACRQLANVSTVLDAKYFADKADALAAWAKIYRSDQAALEAKRLKLHAFRKMGLIAEELRPTKNTGKAVKGARSLLVENGLNHTAAIAALNMSRVSDKKFLDMVVQPCPPGVTRASRGGIGKGRKPNILFSSEYRKAFGSHSGVAGDRGDNVSSLFTFIKNSSVDISDFSISETNRAIEITRICSDWLDELDRKLRHRKSILDKASKKKQLP